MRTIVIKVIIYYNVRVILHPFPTIKHCQPRQGTLSKKIHKPDVLLGQHSSNWAIKPSVWNTVNLMVQVSSICIHHMSKHAQTTLALHASYILGKHVAYILDKHVIPTRVVLVSHRLCFSLAYDAESYVCPCCLIKSPVFNPTSRLPPVPIICLSVSHVITWIDPLKSCLLYFYANIFYRKKAAEVFKFVGADEDEIT